MMGEDPDLVPPARFARDLFLLYLTAFLRAVSTGLIGVLLGIYLAKLRFDAAQIGSVIAAGLAGGACATLLVTLIGDRFGRKRALVCIAVFGAVGGLAASVASTFSAILAAAFLGMLNGMGRDRGAALVLEQAILPATTADESRTKTFAWYNVLQDAGHAIGSLLAGVPYVFRAVLPVGEIASFRLAVGLAAVFILITAVSSIFLLTVPFAPNFPVAAALFLLREGLVEMDVPTRQSYVMAVVRPEERTVASGVTHLVRVGAWAVAPSFAGALMQNISLGIPIYQELVKLPKLIAVIRDGFDGAKHSLCNAGRRAMAAWLAILRQDYISRERMDLSANARTERGTMPSTITTAAEMHRAREKAVRGGRGTGISAGAGSMYM